MLWIVCHLTCSDLVALAVFLHKQSRAQTTIAVMRAPRATKVTVVAVVETTIGRRWSSGSVEGVITRTEKIVAEEM